MNDFVSAIVKIIDLFLSPQKNGFAVLISLIGLVFAYWGYDLFISGIQEGGAAISLSWGADKTFDMGKGGPGLVFCFFGIGLIIFAIYSYSKIKANTDGEYRYETRGLIEIQPRYITKEFDDLLSTANRWRYKGNFGRYMRGKVLPTLSARPNFHISVCILDPTLSDLCEKHAKYRNSINSIDKGKKYDADAVALEVVVTIVVCAWYLTNKNISIDLYLTSVFDPVRIDSNDESMILTVEDRRRPALRITKEHFTFEHFDLQMQFTRQQARTINLIGLRESSTIASLLDADIDTFMNNIGLKSLCDKFSPATILEACRNVTNPYEN